MIYFIRGTTSGSIKIGYTGKDPAQRLAQLQTGSPERLELLGSIPGDVTAEGRLHAKFSAYRIRPDGEWFCGDHELMRRVRKMLRPRGPILLTNDGSEFREPRLLAALGFAEQSSERKLSRLIFSVEDHEGQLRVTWLVPPTDDEQQLFRDAWDFLNEDGDGVIHHDMMGEFYMDSNTGSRTPMRRAPVRESAP